MFGVDLGEESPYYEYDEDGCRVGYDYESDEDDEDDVDDLGEYLALRAGVEDPWQSTPDGYEYDKRHEFPEWEAKYNAWSEATNRLEAAAPVEIETYGVSDWSHYMVVLKGHGVRSDSASAVELPEQPSPDLVEAATKFCEENGLPPFVEPTWLLTASYR